MLMLWVLSSILSRLDRDEDAHRFCYYRPPTRDVSIIIYQCFEVDLHLRNKA
jgi:hypothetical protein